jgi:hypothetical protein
MDPTPEIPGSRAASYRRGRPDREPRATGGGEAHAALRAWCAANGRTIGAYSLEVYGDWSDDPAKLETTIQYLLR